VTWLGQASASGRGSSSGASCGSSGAFT
jgi:hypothetical protein